MKRAGKVIMAIGCAALIFYACKSPLDPTTPRLRYGEPTPTAKNNRIPARSISIIVRNKAQDSLVWHTTIRDTLVQIDTSAYPPALWLHMAVVRSADNPIPPYIHEFWFRVDSLIADSKALPLTRDSSVTPLAGFIIALYRNVTQDSQVVKLNAIPNAASAYVSFHKSGSHVIKGEFSGFVQNYSLPIYAEITIEY
jgi:hypothetical protein